MWQLDADATSASSGSTASAADNGSGTTDGEDDALTVMPPSNDHSCARLYLLSVNFSLLWRFQTTRASYLWLIGLSRLPESPPRGQWPSRPRRSCPPLSAPSE